MKTYKQKIAIVGGGIFGTTCALILGKRFSVTLFERRSDILQEASWANQYRHHMGYHYPRSPETIMEIKAADKDFLSIYRRTVVYDYPSYYCIAKDGSRTSAEQFLRLCKKFNLPHRKEYPPPELLDPKTVEICIRTPEAIYDYKKLKQLVKEKIKKNRSIKLNLDSRIINANISKNGQKILTIKRGRELRREAFDYVINATYANYNEFCGWLGLPKKNLEYRLKEIIVIKLKTKQDYAVFIADGPFATIVPTGQKNIFTFGDAPLSVHEIRGQKTPVLSMEKKLKTLKSRWPKMQKRCVKWMPAIQKAQYLYSMFVILPIETSTKSMDARPTDVVCHGNGCWSILSGKIITCVSVAKKILQEIQLLHK